jgi:hypothetical protein
VPPPPPPGTRDKTAIFSTRKKTSEKKFSFLFIEQIVIVNRKFGQTKYASIIGGTTCHCRIGVIMETTYVDDAVRITR